MTSVSKSISSLQNTIAPLHSFMQESTWSQREPSAEDCDFTFGNPHELPLPEYVEVLKKVTEPQNKDWFAYKQSEPEARAAISKSLTKRFNHSFTEDDIFLTNGAVAALDVVIKTITDREDEVIYISPHWFLYEGMILSAGGKAVNVRIDPLSFDLDLEAIEAAITSHTRAIIINSPNNPSGKIYSRETLSTLSKILSAASAKNGRTVYLISDEAYSHILFDDNDFISPSTIYPSTFLVYTYGKVHLTPGQRIGYIALPETMPDREVLRQAINTVQMFSGWAFPNAILQYAIPELDKLSIDCKKLQARRDRFISALSEIGYITNNPEGTFYLLVKTPIEDDVAYVELLAQYKVYCLPGVTFGLPGYLRISLTANDEMLERSINGFSKAYRNSKS
jgi:aspartate aminotransferase